MRGRRLVPMLACRPASTTSGSPTDLKEHAMPNVSNPLSKAIRGAALLAGGLMVLLTGTAQAQWPERQIGRAHA